MKIGIFSTFIEPAALELVRAIQDAVMTREIPDSEISFIFSNRAIGESQTTDGVLSKLCRETTPLISLSAARFKPEMRKKAKEEENSGLMSEWRNRFGEEVLKRLPNTDIDLLLGDMYIWGANMCTERKGINLHPALPDGPKGEWYKVIWNLIQNQAKETGVMMHRVVPELDRGPAVAYCGFPIRGYQFDILWNQVPEDRGELLQIVQQGLLEKEQTQYPLHRKIRGHGLAREFPLVIQTARAFAEGEIRIEGSGLVDHEGKPIEGGHNLTRQINEVVKPQLEGAFAQKEART